MKNIIKRDEIDKFRRVLIERRRNLFDNLFRNVLKPFLIAPKGVKR